MDGADLDPLLRQHGGLVNRRQTKMPRRLDQGFCGILDKIHFSLACISANRNKSAAKRQPSLSQMFAHHFADRSPAASSIPPHQPNPSSGHFAPFVG
ncbi:hypothetical protein [Bradyrhizobium sp.]